MISPIPEYFEYEPSGPYIVSVVNADMSSASGRQETLNAAILHMYAIGKPQPLIQIIMDARNRFVFSMRDDTIVTCGFVLEEFGRILPANDVNTERLMTIEMSNRFFYDPEVSV